MKSAILYTSALILTVSLSLSAQTYNNDLQAYMDWLKNKITTYGDKVTTCNFNFIQNTPQIDIEIQYKDQIHNDCIMDLYKDDTTKRQQLTCNWMPENELLVLEIHCGYCIEYNDKHKRGAEFDFVRLYFARNFFDNSPGLQDSVTRAFTKLTTLIP